MMKEATFCVHISNGENKKENEHRALFEVLFASLYETVSIMMGEKYKKITSAVLSI